MMKRNLIVAVAACAFAAPAFAQGARGNNFIDGYGVLSEIDTRFGDDDGKGAGVKGALQVHEKVFLAGEFQTVDYDGGDVDQIRLGAAFGPGAGSRNEGIYGRAQYVDFDFDGGGDQDGLGGHVGYALPLSKEFRLHGEAGYLLLDDLDGPELLIGGTFQIAQNIALFGDIRGSFLEFDGPGNTDIDVTDLRLGARFLF